MHSQSLFSLLSDFCQIEVNTVVNCGYMINGLFLTKYILFTMKTCLNTKLQNERYVYVYDSNYQMTHLSASLL